MAVFSNASLFGSNSATQTVTFSVIPINEISVTGNPGTMTVSTSPAGAAPNTASDSSTSYAITTNGSYRKITAAINSPMPVGVTLTVDVTAPTGATSAGAVMLGTTPADVVTGITGIAESGRRITYVSAATSEAGVINSQSRTVTLTVTAGAN